MGLQVRLMLYFQYYYNSTTGQFMYWDAEQSTYLPAPSDESQSDMRSLDNKDAKKDGKDKKEKVKVAKKIAKVFFSSY